MFATITEDGQIHGVYPTLDAAQQNAKKLSAKTPNTVFHVVKTVWSCGSIKPESNVKAGDFDWDNPKPDPYNF